MTEDFGRLKVLRKDPHHSTRLKYHDCPTIVAEKISKELKGKENLYQRLICFDEQDLYLLSQPDILQQSPIEIEFEPCIAYSEVNECVPESAYTSMNSQIPF